MALNRDFTAQVLSVDALNVDFWDKDFDVMPGDWLHFCVITPG
jgi:hypothetical protein